MDFRPERDEQFRPLSIRGGSNEDQHRLPDELCCHIRLRGMEPLWSPVVATRGKQRQIDRAPKPQKQAKAVAIGCDRLPREVHGKEGVDGSSPSEGLDYLQSPRPLELGDESVRLKDRCRVLHRPSAGESAP